MATTIYDLDETAYHAHEALGSTSIKTLSDTNISMAEVKVLLNSNEHKRVFDTGSLAHALILEGSLDRLVERVDVDAWRTNDAKESKAKAYAAGKIPINNSEVESILAPVERMADSVMSHRLASSLLTDFKPEVSAFWEQDGIPLKARFDAYRETHGQIIDLKTTRSARPGDVRKSISDLGYYIQSQHYLNGAQAVTGFIPDWKFVFVQNCEPYTVSVGSLEPEALRQAQARIDIALRRYQEAQSSGNWPGYEQEYKYGLTPWESIKNEDMSNE